jgi:PAS domain S-box-containing protein
MAADTASDLAPPRAAPIPRRAYLLAVVVLLGSLALVALYARGAGQRERALADARFVAEAEQVTGLLRQTLSSYELTTRGGVSLVATLEQPTSRHWRNYVDGLDIGQRFPAMVGLGFAAYLTPQQLQELQLDRRRDGEGLFTINPAGMRQRYGPIVQLEPRTPENVAAIGFDMFADPVRAEAMEAARDSGTARISGPVRLVQDRDEPDTGGLLIYAPVYRSGFVPVGTGAREAALVGWVYAPLRVRAFVANALGTTAPALTFRILDVTGPGERLVYTASTDPRAFSSEAGPRHIIEETVHGRRWRLEFDPLPGSGKRFGTIETTVAIGLLASLLLFLVALSLARTQVQAQRLAVRMSESYRRSEVRFRNAMRYSAIGKALLDARGRIVEANLALADTLRSSPDELAGTALVDLFVDGREDLDADGRLRVSRDGVYRVTRTLHRSDGDVRRVHMIFAPVPGEIGQDVAALVQVEDITDRLRAEAQVHALNRTLELRVAQRTRELTRANEELEAFAYSVSHDLRAPLRAIDGFSRLLLERHGDGMDQAGRDQLGRIRAATVRMGELIDALLKMSRLSRGEMRRTPLDLSRMGNEILAELAQGSPHRQVSVSVQPGMHATGDAALVHNLLLNLLGNAWKFTSRTGHARIEFGQERAGPEPVFFVRDNGAGFDQQYVDKLFRPFQRLHGQGDFAGHGIGLASVKRIVERHGGTISAEGSEGGGACFRFTLPDEAGPEDAAG